MHGIAKRNTCLSSRYFYGKGVVGLLNVKIGICNVTRSTANVMIFEQKDLRLLSDVSRISFPLHSIIEQLKYYFSNLHAGSRN